MKRKTFSRLLITYVICFALLIVISLGTYVFVCNIFIERCLQSNADEAEDGINALCDDIDRFSVLVSQQRSLTDYTRISGLDHPFMPRNLLWLEIARKRLEQSVNSMSLKSGLIDCALLYQNDSCITIERTFENSGDYYGKYFHYNGITLPEWRTMLTRCATSGITIMNQRPSYYIGKGNFSAITIVESAKYYYAGDVKNIAYMVLDADKILSGLATPDVKDVCCIVLYNGTGAPIAVMGNSIRSDYRSVYYSSARYPALSARIDIPMSVIYSQLQPLLYILCVSMSVYLCCGIILTLWFSYHNSLPVRALSNQLGQHCVSGAPENEYEFIENEIYRMQTDLKNARLELVIRDKTMRAAAVEQLMYGNLNDSRSLSIAHMLFRDFPEKYCICLMRVGSQYSEYRDSAVYRAFDIIRQDYRACSGDNAEMYLSGSDTVLCMLPLCGEYDSPHSYATLLGRLYQDVFANTSMLLTIAVSDEFAGPASLPAACNQARQILRVSPCGTARIFFRDDFSEQVSLSPVEYTDSQRFYEALMSMNTAAGVTMIRNAFDSIRCGLYSDIYVEQVYFTFRRVFDRIEFELRSSGEQFTLKTPVEFSITSSADELESGLIRMTDECAGYIDAVHRQRSTMLDAEIIVYIEHNIGSCELCARSVAEYFSTSEREIQAIIKRSVNMPFFDYVEELRMAKARELITTTSMTISDIALQCGFTLPNSFYKAFKRHFNVSPSSLRTRNNIGGIPDT